MPTAGCFKSCQSSKVAKEMPSAPACICPAFDCRLVGLPDANHFDDLLGNKHGTAKKGAMKTTASSSRVGSIVRVNAVHLGDGKPLTLDLQVCVRARLQQSSLGFTGNGNTGAVPLTLNLTPLARLPYTTCGIRDTSPKGVCRLACRPW